MKTPNVNLVSGMISEMKSYNDIVVYVQNFKFDEKNIDFLDDMVPSFEQLTNSRLSTECQDLLIFPALIEFVWGISSRPKISSGGFRIENIENCLTVQNNLINTTNVVFPNDIREYIDNIYYFDMCEILNWNTGTLLLNKYNRESPRLLFMDGGNIYSMNLSIENYFRELVKMKAIYYWQYAYCDENIFKQLDRLKKDTVLKSFGILKKTFRSTDIPDFISKKI